MVEEAMEPAAAEMELEQLRQRVAQLERDRGAGRLDDLQRRESAMLRAFAAIGESASLLSHEIKNPRTAVHLALRAVATELGEEPRQVLEDLVGRLDALEQRMRQTLSFVAPLDLRTGPCDARALFDGAVSSLRPEIERHHAHVSSRVAPGEVGFSGDRPRLQQVLSNLVANGIEAGGDGRHVEFVATRARDGAVLLAVEDDGPGIAPSLRDSLFKPFVTTKPKGIGLGLATCRRIVEAQGGTIVLATGSLRGARFEIRLPAQTTKTNA